VSISADRAIKPASNMKILTTLAALEVLGPDFEYVTELRSTKPIARAEIAGDLILRGTGDPNISGRHQKSPTELIELWARRLAEEAGYTRFEPIPIPSAMQQFFRVS